VVVCATTARQPVFDSAVLADRVTVLAIGSHEPTAGEVDAEFCRRATVVVEDTAITLRECGEVVQVIAAGALTAQRLVPNARGGPRQWCRRPARCCSRAPAWAWQDVVVAEAVLAEADGAA
jgi:hypothetical protein